MRKWKSSLLFAAALLALYSGAADASYKEVVLRISDMVGGNGLPGKEARTIAEKARRAVVEDFLRQNPGIRFTAETGIKVPGEAQEAALMMAMAGGSAGEILYVNFRTMDQFITQNFLYPLDEYVFDWYREVKNLPKDAPLSLKDIDPEALGIHPEVWKVVCRRGNDGIRHCYCIPYGTVVMALIYRKDLFKEAGLDPNKPPANWDELYDYAVKLTDPSKGQYGIGSDPVAWHFIDFLWQGGSECVVEEEDGNWRAVFNDDNAVNTLRYVRKLFCTKVKSTDPETGKESEGTVGRRGWEYFEDFSRGKCAMFMHYTSDTQLATITDLQPSVLGISALPEGPVRRANEINAPMWGISSQVKDKAKRDASWKFIRHQASEDAKRIFTKIYVQGGYANTVSPKYLEKFGYSEYLDEIPQSWREANASAFTHGRPEPNGRNCARIYLQMKLPLDKVLEDKHAFERSQLKPGSAEYEADTRYLKQTLDEAVASTNLKLMGKIPEETLQVQRKMAWIAV
ncbi:MAG TPA: extracellular solute-binding protein, partial [Planctomycetota bacterium]|nr:extracellular solute-binding protein [Planctomycetota bacterium]